MARRKRVIYETPKKACDSFAAQMIYYPNAIATVIIPEDPGYSGRWCAISNSVTGEGYPSTYTYATCPANSMLSPGLVCQCMYGYFAEGDSCTPPTIEISGASSTRALPSLVGPITQIVSVTHNGSPKESVGVDVVFQVAGSSVTRGIGGKTKADGTYEFLFVPPYFEKTTVTLTASCATCSNTDSKTIDVLSSELEEPQMCRR